MRFSTNGSPNTLVFGDVKMLRKFEGYHPQQDTFEILVKPNPFATDKPDSSKLLLECRHRNRQVWLL